MFPSILMKIARFLRDHKGMTLSAGGTSSREDSANSEGSINTKLWNAGFPITSSNVGKKTNTALV